MLLWAKKRIAQRAVTAESARSNMLVSALYVVALPTHATVLVLASVGLFRAFGQVITDKTSGPDSSLTPAQAVA